MFGFSIVKPPFSFTDIKTITIPAICSVNNSGTVDISKATPCLLFLRKISFSILLPYLGLQSNQVAKRLKSCVYKFYSCVNLKIVFQSTRCIKSFFPYKDRITRSQQSRVIYRANCWDCNGFYIGKTKRRLHDRKTEHFKALAKNDNTSAIADHVKATGHNIKWDHFDILAKGKTDYHCKIKETLYIQELEPAFNVNVGSEKLMLY